MNTPTVIRCTSPADILATLPRMLGFDPGPGVYLIPFHNMRASGAVRVDLPSPELIAPYDTPHPTNRALAWMSDVLGLASFAKRVAIIIRTDSPFAGESGTPSYYGLASALAHSFHRMDIDLAADPILHAADGYAELSTATATPHPLTDITEHPEYSTDPLPTIEEWRAAREHHYPNDKAERVAWQEAITNN